MSLPELSSISWSTVPPILGIVTFLCRLTYYHSQRVTLLHALMMVNKTHLIIAITVAI